MKILRKNAVEKVEEKVIEEKKALDEKAIDNTVITLTGDEVELLRDLLPKIAEFFAGEAELEIIDDEVEEETEEEVEEEVEEAEEENVDIEELEEEIEAEEVEEEPKAKDDASTFNADDILKDPAKKAAIEKALGVEKKATDAPSKKVYVKKSLPIKKAGDSIDEVLETKPNAEFVATPVTKKEISENRVIKKFDFHKNQK